MSNANCKGPREPFLCIGFLVEASEKSFSSSAPFGPLLSAVSGAGTGAGAGSVKVERSFSSSMEYRTSPTPSSSRIAYWF